MNHDPFAPLNRAPAATTDHAKDDWQPIVPIPADAPQPPASHHKYGKPTATWCYRNASGLSLGFVKRFDTDEGKIFQPQTFGRRSPTAKSEWRWKGWTGRRPLYGLDRLAERPNAPVLVTEGEKAADAAAELLPDMVAVTSPNGSKSAAKADWSALRGRRVTIWPDADAAGLDYANAVAKLVTAAEAVAIISPPQGCSTGWDAADAKAEGWDAQRAAELVADAIPPPNGGAVGEAGDKGGRRRPPQRDVVIELTERCEFWHDANRVAYATFPINSHHENWAVRSREFRMWLSGQYYEDTGRAIGGQALEDAIRILEARAVYDGPLYEPSSGPVVTLAKSISIFAMIVAGGRDYPQRLAHGVLGSRQIHAAGVAAIDARTGSRRHDRGTAALHQCARRSVHADCRLADSNASTEGTISDPGSERRAGGWQIDGVPDATRSGRPERRGDPVGAEGRP